MAVVIGSQPIPTVAQEMERHRGCFRESVQDGLIGLTRAFAYAMFDGNGKANSSLFVKEGLFLGGIFGDIRGGVEAYEEFCDMLSALDLRIVFTKQSFAVHPFNLNECLVVFGSHLVMKEGSSEVSMVSKPLRIVFNWLLVGDLPHVQYLELSFPLSHGKALDSPGLAWGLDGDLESAAREGGSEEGVLEVHNTNRGLVFLHYDDILCVRAEGRKSHIQLRDGSIDVSESIGQIQSMVMADDESESPFIRVHRSYLINAWHLWSLTTERAKLDDGTIVNVSARRIPEIRAKMRDLRRPRSLPLREFAQIVHDAD